MEGAAMSIRLSILFASTGLLLAGCSSAQKARLAEREKVSAASGMYCEFISGDVHNDIDVELNLQIGKRCDANKPFTMTNYKNSSENYGVIYCCSLAKKEEKKDEKKVETRHFGPKDDAAANDELDMKADAKKPEEKKAEDKKVEKAAPKTEVPKTEAPKTDAKPAAPAAPSAPANGSPSASNPKSAPPKSAKPPAPQHAPASNDAPDIFGE
jgi:outer membrane biosynthesis protein TonB